jgi:hypothetical protein
MAPAGVGGNSSDLTVRSGMYPGYQVIYPCPLGQNVVGVRGLGSKKVTGTADTVRVGQALLTSFKDVPSTYGGGGEGVECEPGLGTELYVDDWRDMNQVIERTGQSLAQQDLDLQVAVFVQPIPTALNGD